MKYGVLSLDARNKTEFDMYEREEAAERAYTNRVQMSTDKYVVLLQMDGTITTPLATYYRRY